MTALLTPEQVAEELGISVDRVKRRTTAEGWPHVRLSAKAIRYRAEHVEQIIARFEIQAEPVTGIAGQTTRSRRRSA